MARRVCSALDDERAVDDDVLDAVGEAARLVVGRVRADVRVEHDEVRDEPVERCGRDPSTRGGGGDVILATASSSERIASSRTNWPRSRV